MSLKQVVIVGKPNVGKSQLFNRLTGERHSVVFSEPGVTRDRVTLEVSWFDKKFLLTDTGGYTLDEMSFQDEMNRQTEIALSESDLIVLVVSCKEGIDNDDVYLSKILKRKKAKNVVLVANKCDCLKSGEDIGEYKLGYGDALFISSEHGINTGLLLETIIEKLNIGTFKEEELVRDKSRLRLAIIGRPNVGKSSLVNSLLKEKRIITSEIAGTTRDAIDLDFEFLGKKYKLIDTPGIRRHASIYKDTKEKYSVLRSKKAISRSDMVLLVFDISEELSELDERVGGLIYEANIPSIIVVNKFDLVKENHEEVKKEFEKKIKKKFKFLSWSPVVFVSAKESSKLDRIFKQIELIKTEINKKIPDYLLHDFLYKISFLFSVPAVKAKK
ncbi:ribosome biogenesis GTPase Der [Candidatus Mycoplasma haematohominis]|uniref:ribosome biogenesis GTPase Der n=1 Tax=Candidatus Mycoplasma haematohominis TaxID=1494318 RepID=UPI001FED1CD9|nr:ribosome biogenesis GTPase Der [Candidatus Mycoplasma haemohominis]